MSEDIKEFEVIKKNSKGKPKKKYKKKDKDIGKDVVKDILKIEISDKRKEFLKLLESRFTNNEFLRYKDKIFKIKTFKCSVEGKGHIELFNKKFSCTVGLLVENLIEKDFEFDL